MYGYWRRRFGGDASIVARTIRVDGKERIVIGVMPERFHFLDNDSLLLVLPFKFDRSKTTLGDFSYPAVARLKPGATVAEANADVARMLPIVNRSFPAPPGFSVKQLEEVGIGPNVLPLKRVVVGDVGELLWVLMAGIGMVLLIACANVANLLLVRAEGRQQELAIRVALGATPGRIAAELLFESLILSLWGSALGLGFAYAALRFLVAMAPAGLPRLSEIGIDAPVLLFTLGVSFVAGLLFGSVPVLKHAGGRLGTGLREGGRTLSDSRERHRARNALVIVQVGLALMLLISSGPVIRTFRALASVHPGFVGPAEVQTLSLTISHEEVPEPERLCACRKRSCTRSRRFPVSPRSAWVPASLWMGVTAAIPSSHRTGPIPRGNFQASGISDSCHPATFAPWARR